MAIRKDANTLSASERAEFVSAVHALKTAGIYDQFVLRHANAIMSAIHRCPAFLPWHRRFIWDFERELQRVSGNPALGLPYWNWPEGGSDASMWGSDLLGGNGDPVSQVVADGAFRGGEWRVVNSSGVAVGPLTRAFGRESWARALPTQDEIEEVLAITPYDSAPWNAGSTPSFRNQLEGFRGPNLHNRGHGWVGGSMLPMTSPNDPVFFMHHCMVDKVWHEWQLRFPSHDYLPMTGGPFGQNLTDPMDSTPAGPIGNRPVDVIDSAALNIEYDALMPGTPSAEPVPSAGQPLIVGGPSFDGSVDTPGEVDLYTFEVTAFGTHVIETTGPSDTVASLFGPDDATNQLAVNDDGGADLNSRLSMSLSAGSYVVRVRLFGESQTGAYAIAVTGDGDAEIPSLTVDGTPLDSSIGAQSESDLYQFRADDQGDYVIETAGTTDTFLTLAGPDSQTTQIAQNDDGGTGLNSRISRRLDPGLYFVRVRHFSPLATGPYQVGVRRS